MLNHPLLQPRAASAASLARTRSTIETLESRIAPAAVTAPATVSYTDADGDVVKVKINGGFTSVTFLDSTGADVLDQGGDIAKIEVAGAKPDFQLIFVDTNDGHGADTIELGTISAPGGGRLPLIKGVSALESASDAEFHLNGFIGTDFSARGGLFIAGALTGSGATGGGLDLSHLAPGRTVSFRDGITADASAVIPGKLAGLFVADHLVAGVVTLGPVSGVVDFGDVRSDVTVAKAFTGKILVDDVGAGDDAGKIKLQLGMGPNATVASLGNLDLSVLGSLAGHVSSGDGVATIDVSRSIAGADLALGGNAILTVGGSIKSSSILVHGQLAGPSTVAGGVTKSSITAGLGLQLEVQKSAMLSHFSSGRGSELDERLFVQLDFSDSEVIGGDGIDFTVGGNVTNSRISPDGDLAVNITGKVTGTQLASQSSDLTGTITGRVVNSAFIAGAEIDIVLNDNVTTSSFGAGGSTNVAVGGKLTGAQLSSGFDMQLLLGNDTKDTATGIEALAGNSLVVAAAANVSNSRFVNTDGIATLGFAGKLSSTVVDSGQSLTILQSSAISSNVMLFAAEDVAVTSSGDVAGRIIAGRDVALNVGGVLKGSLSAVRDVSIHAASIKISPVAAKLTYSGINALTLDPLDLPGISAGENFSLVTTGDVIAPRITVGNDINDLRIGGRLNAVLNVGGDLLAGEPSDATVVMVAGIVAKSARINIAGNVGSDSTAPKFSFTGPFLGSLQVGGKLLTDLEFSADVNRLAFDGGIGESGAAVADIVVNGKLASLATGSLFNRQGPNGGQFTDGSGAVSGTVSATGGAPAVTVPSFI